LPPLPPTPEEVAAAQATLAAASDTTSADVEPDTSTTEDAVAPSVTELEAKVAELEAAAPKPETDAQKIARLEAQLIQQSGSVVGALSQALHVTDPAIPLAAIEPGVRWAVKQGLMDAEKLGPHIVKLLEDGLL
jgi:hypothetical protein